MRSSKKILSVHLGRIASADTVEEFEKELETLKEREIWTLEQNKNFVRRWRKHGYLNMRQTYFSFQLEVFEEAFYREESIIVLYLLSCTLFLDHGFAES